MCLDEDETANLLEDASTPIEEVLHKLTNGAVKAPTNTGTHYTHSNAVCTKL